MILNNKLSFPIQSALCTALLAASSAVCAQAPSTGSGSGSGQTYPTKPIRVIVPFAPGGANDITIRTLNVRLPALLGQSLIIDNRPGAGGNIGAELTAKSPPDGYTLLIANNSLIMNASLYRKLPYDPFRDFVPISMAATSPNMVVSHPALPARNVKELVALAKSKPGEISYASPGAGTSSHLAGALFGARTGANIQHVPYKGAGPLMVDQIGGHVMLSFTAPIVSKPHIDSGKLRAIAVTSEKRWAAMPNLPSVAESGYPGFDVYVWVAFFAPAGTPRPIIDRVASDVAKALESKEVKERFAAASIEAGASTPDGLAQFMKKDFELWDKLIKAQGIKLD
jgi:tripartite-type tricarboxylate transporter receptor subunit TctC